MYQTANLFLTPGLKMSEVIINNPYLVILLENFGISMPLHDKTVQTVCTENKLNTELFLILANLYNGLSYNPDIPLSFNDTSSIILFLKNSHQYYLQEIYPNILNVIEKLAEVNTVKEIDLVRKFFIGYFDEVREHLSYEDQVVFPYVLSLAGRMSDPAHTPEKSAYSVMEYKEHHNDIEEKLNDLKNLLIKYLPQKEDQILRRKLLFSLSELEYDLNIHAKIEDLILIPLVTEMENQVKKER
jgi:regulator of cell morphogenesis and NO signaling